MSYLTDDDEDFDPSDLPGSPAATVDDDPVGVADNAFPFNTVPADADAGATGGGGVSFLGGLSSFITGIGQVAQAGRDAGLIAPGQSAATVPVTAAPGTSQIDGKTLAIAGGILAAVIVAVVALRRRKP